jgi:hypothetical protein
MGTRLILDQAARARDSKIVAVTTQDVEPIIEANKAGLNADRGEYGRKVAEVPNVIITLWLYEEAARGNHIRLFSPEFYAMAHRKLADPDWKYLLV